MLWLNVGRYLVAAQMEAQLDARSKQLHVSLASDLVRVHEPLLGSRVERALFSTMISKPEVVTVDPAGGSRQGARNGVDKESVSFRHCSSRSDMTYAYKLVTAPVGNRTETACGRKSTSTARDLPLVPSDVEEAREASLTLG